MTNKHAIEWRWRSFLTPGDTRSPWLTYPGTYPTARRRDEALAFLRRKERMLAEFKQRESCNEYQARNR
jgi:hypothetical protein